MTNIKMILTPGNYRLSGNLFQQSGEQTHCHPEICLTLWSESTLDSEALVRLFDSAGIDRFKLSSNSNHRLMIELEGDLAYWQRRLATAKTEGFDYFIFGLNETFQKPKLIVFDMDSTLIQIECIDEIARKQGLYDQVAAITESAMRGEIDFATSLKQRVALLAGLSQVDFLSLAQNLPLTNGVKEVVCWAKNNNCKIAVVSGGFVPFVEAIKQQLELDYAMANQLEVSAGKLTGKLRGEIVDANYKSIFLNKLSDDLGLKTSQVWAVGDGANDIAMLNSAGLGVAFCAKPRVREHTRAVINRPDMRGLVDFIEKR